MTWAVEEGIWAFENAFLGFIRRYITTATRTVLVVVIRIGALQNTN
jgi:hypothetical protein